MRFHGIQYCMLIPKSAQGNVAAPAPLLLTVLYPARVIDHSGLGSKSIALLKAFFASRGKVENLMCCLGTLWSRTDQLSVSQSFVRLVSSHFVLSYL